MQGVAGQPWIDEEIEVVLDAYFKMLLWEIEGREFVKADVRESVAADLPARSKKSIELKWCNVSAVLDQAGMPWVMGFKPLSNFQAKLVPAVETWLERNPRVRAKLVG